jgi:K+-sensing histidine kinase KdpD
MNSDALTSIKGFASTLLQKDIEWSEEEKWIFIHEIDTETDRLSRLVSDLLAVSSIENKTFKITKNLALLI